MRNKTRLISSLKASSICLWVLTFGHVSAVELPLVLKGGGKVNCEIVVPEESGPVAAFAGRELQTFMSKSLGGDVPIVKAPGGTRTAVILGNCQLTRAAGIDVAKFPRDGFVISTAGKNIFIAGRDDMKVKPENTMNSVWKVYYERGTLFGAYDFLERFFGVRFFFPGETGTVVPRHEVLTVPENIDISEKPDYSVRMASWNGDTCGPLDWIPDKKQWYAEKNLMYYRLRLETDYIPSCHGLVRLNLVERFGKSHPEYFALMPDGRRYKEPDMPHSGQLCLSSGVKEEIYKDAVAYFSGETAKSRGIWDKDEWPVMAAYSKYFDLMPQDGFYCCKCDKCQVHFSKGPQATSEFIWQYVIDIAEKLRKDGFDADVTMMAYSPYRIVPADNIPGNVVVKLALGGPWYMKKGDSFQHELKDIDAWTGKMGDTKLTLWNYPCKFAKLAIPDVPHTTPQAVGGYYQRLGNKIRGAYMESNAETPAVIKYSHGYLNTYIFSKVAWNNGVDIEALLKDHHQKMFGAAAAPMGKAFEKFEKNWLEIVGRPVETPLGPQFVPLSDYGIWEKVYSSDEMAELEGLFNTAEKDTANDAEALARVMFIRGEFLAPLQKRRNQYLANQKAINDLRFSAKAVPAGTKIILDGKLDDAAWTAAAPIPLVPHADEKGAKDTVRTTVKAARDAENLYFAFDCEEPEMVKLVSSKRSHDDKELWKDSEVEIFLNPSGDRDEYYQIIVNADGSAADYRCKKYTGQSDIKWDSGATAVTLKGNKSWTAEIAIPLKNLAGFSAEKDFPANFCRSRTLTGDSTKLVTLYTWSPFLRGGFHDLDNFGYITFKGVKSGNIIGNSSFTDEVRYNTCGPWILPQAKNLKPFESWKINKDAFTESGRSLSITMTPPADDIFSATQYLPALKPDTEYLLSFAVKIEGLKLENPQYAGVVVNVWDEKNRWFPNNYYTTDMPWTRQGFTFRTGPETNKKCRSYIRLTLSRASGTASFGDVKLVEVIK